MCKSLSLSFQLQILKDWNAIFHIFWGWDWDPSENYNCGPIFKRPKGKMSLENQVGWFWFFAYMNLNLAGYTDSKNQVQNRQKNKFIFQTQFFKNQVQINKGKNTFSHLASFTCDPVISMWGNDWRCLVSRTFQTMKCIPLLISPGKMSKKLYFTIFVWFY